MTEPLGQCRSFSRMLLPPDWQGFYWMRRCTSFPGSDLQRLDGGRAELASATRRHASAGRRLATRYCGDCSPNVSRVVITRTEMMTSVQLRGRETPACGRAAFIDSRSFKNLGRSWSVSASAKPAGSARTPQLRRASWSQHEQPARSPSNSSGASPCREWEVLIPHRSAGLQDRTVHSATGSSAPFAHRPHAPRPATGAPPTCQTMR